MFHYFIYFFSFLYVQLISLSCCCAAFDTAATLKNTSETYDLYLQKLHPLAYHRMTSCNESRSIIQLENGSIWRTRPEQKHVIFHWNSYDDLFIKPIASWFSSYSYVLHNLTKEEIVEINFIDYNPNPKEPSLSILQIDPQEGIIYLSNGTKWQTNPEALSSDWQASQPVMIGVNNYWRTIDCPLILLHLAHPSTHFLPIQFLDVIPLDIEN